MGLLNNLVQEDSGKFYGMVRAVKSGDGIF